MKVIFLDIDGVLNNAHLLSTSCESWDCIGPHQVGRLNEILQATGARIVLSSAWRYKLDTIEKIERRLQMAGMLPGRVEGRTVFSTKGSTRGVEIDQWLQEHQDVTSYVVLEDDWDTDPIPYDRIVRTEFEGYGGLKFEHIAEAIEILNTPLKEDER